MTRRLAGAVASCLTLLAGLWLILAPFALGVQPSGADWKDETLTDVWSGIGLGALGLIGLIVFAAALVGSVREQGLVTPRRTTPAADEPSTPAPAAPGQAPTSDLDQLLAPLITALTEDLNRDRQRASANGEVNGEVDGETAGEAERRAGLYRPAESGQDAPGGTR